MTWLMEFELKLWRWYSVERVLVPAVAQSASDSCKPAEVIPLAGSSALPAIMLAGRREKQSNPR
jgi:hypothetical protein